MFSYLLFRAFSREESPLLSHDGLNTPRETAKFLHYVFYGISPGLTLPGRDAAKRKESFMLRWAAIFLIIAIIAAIFGFGGIAGTAAAIAKVLFFIFIAICVILFLAGLFAGRNL